MVEIIGGNLIFLKNTPKTFFRKNWKFLKFLQVQIRTIIVLFCFIYVLGLADEYDSIKDFGSFIYDTFLQKLLNDKILEYTNNPQSGNYILYRDLKNYPDMITHAGIIEKDDIIVSKWAWGPLFRHKIFDVF